MGPLTKATPEEDLIRAGNERRTANFKHGGNRASDGLIWHTSAFNVDLLNCTPIRSHPWIC
jgi:hypothetical protein